MQPQEIFRTLPSVLEMLNKNKAESPQGVAALLETFNAAVAKHREQHNVKPISHPLIVLEGLDGSGKSTVGHRLAKRIKGVKWSTPPASIKPIRHLFDGNAKLRAAYYALGNYLGALEVALELQERPVVIDRYWYSTSCFALAQDVHSFPGDVEMPPEGDAFYVWPEDLLKPDVVLFLDVEESVRVERLSRRPESTPQEELLKNSAQFRNNILLAYKRMVDPKVVFVQSTVGFEAVLRQIDEKIAHLLH